MIIFEVLNNPMKLS